MIVPTVGIARCKEARYPSLPPYSPNRVFPELVFLPAGSINPVDGNPVYEEIRQSFFLAGWDTQNYGSETWNPLGEFIHPGSQILIKPNFVLHEYSPSVKDCLVTHGSIIRVALDYAFLAGGATCHITIADAPEQVADFNRILEQTGLPEIVAFYRDRLNFKIDVFDLRTVASDWDGERGFLPPNRRLSGDPHGYVDIDLGSQSALEPITQSATRFGIANYSRASLQERHKPGHHEYLVSRSVLEADTVISLPKMKTHEKAGLTGALKSFVGINGCKDWLPHYRLGSERSGGDEHPGGQWTVGANRAVKEKLQRRSAQLWSAASKVWSILRTLTPASSYLPSGAWYGNDTIWRMILDLNRILIFSDRNGCLCDRPQRQSCFIVDGIIAGEGNGPLSPTPKRAGVVIAGDDPVAIDIVLAQLMGYDWRKLPLLSQFSLPNDDSQFTKFDGENIRAVTETGVWNFDKLESMGFVPPNGWKNYIELVRE